MLNGQDGWRFTDHGDGFGVIYNVSPITREVAAFSVCLARYEHHVEQSAKLVREMKRDIPPTFSPACNTLEEPRACLDHDVPADQLIAQTDARIRALGAHPVDHGGGGDCFFRVLAALVPQLSDASRHLEARRAVVDYIRRHERVFGAFVAQPDEEPGGPRWLDFPGYCDWMAQQGTYVNGDIEIMAAARVYNVNIQRYSFEEARDTLTPVEHPNCYTGLITMVHYETPGDLCHYCEFRRVGGEAAGEPLSAIGG